jgi:transposase InsO family protein
VILALIDEAVANGAGLEAACETINLSARTVQRWREDPDGDDERVGPRTKPPHALTTEERARIVELATSPRYRDLSPNQIVPLLADQKLYVASEASFYRVLREEKLLAHRSAARPAKRHKPKACVATGPCQVWSWDITYLRAAVRGTFYYLYLVLDIWSRKIVAWEVYEVESDEHAATLIRAAAAAERVDPNTLTLHSDNGSAMKGATMLATLQRLGIAPSFSRPRVSDDNAAVEALFRTLKYRPGYPRKPFASLAEARA